MSAYTPGYRPEIRQTLYMSFMHEAPFLATVNGFHRDPRIPQEQIEFTTAKLNKARSSSIGFYRFYPNAPIDSKYCYSVFVSTGNDREHFETVEEYFLDPQSAFDFKARLESGEAKSRCEFYIKGDPFRVEVEQL
ncbi:MAG: hypothetical protein E2577_20245 [Starkeya sp.]|nr:hypothetical protein [Starkeya sp.]